MSLSTRTRYWTVHVACAVLGPSITIGFDKAPEDPVASPLQPANAWRSVPLTGIIDEFTDAMPKDPPAYHPLPEALPNAVSTVRYYCTCQAATTRCARSIVMAEDPDESVPEASPNQPWNSARAPFPREIVPTSRRAVVCVPASYQPAVNGVPYAVSIRRLY